MSDPVTDAMEPSALFWGGDPAAFPSISIAISLRRIADALERGGFGGTGDRLQDELDALASSYGGGT